MEEDTQHNYPLLDKLKNNRFSGDIPEGYLDQLAEKMSIDRTEIESKSYKKNLSFYVLRIAAVSLMVLTTYFCLQQFNSSSMDQELFAEVPEDILLEYAVNNSSDFNLDLLSELYYTDTETQTLSTEDEESLEYIDLELIEEYLIQETL